MRYNPFRVSIFFICILAGCAQFKKSNSTEGFENAMSLMKSGDVYKATKLFGILCAEGVQVSCWASGKRVEIAPSLAIMQGASDSVSTQITVTALKNKKYRFYARNMSSGKVLKSSQKKVLARSHSDWSVVRLDFTGLSANTDYEFVVAGTEGDLVDLRTFRVLAPSSAKIKFAVASCMQEKYKDEQKRQWKDLVSYKPDAIFMIGDNVYADIKMGIFSKTMTPEKLWNRYVDSRRAFQIFFEPKLIPVFATWDDHDYGLNNGGQEFAYKKASAKIFEAFFPQEKNAVVIDHGPGVSKLVSFGGQTFALLDDRTFRTPPMIKAGQAHFGEEQEKWLLSHLKKSKQPFWIVSGDQFFGGYHPYESYQGNHPVAFDKFMYKLRQTGNRYVLISGDRHLSEIMKLPPKVTGFQTYELTSSGIHSIVFPGSFKKWPNPLAMEAVDGVMNFMIIESQAKGRGLEMDVHSVGLGNKTLFRKTLNVR